MKKIVIFGGTFDPPHIGHIETARFILNEMHPDALLVFPAGIPPHKRIMSDSSPADRLKMTKLAFEPLEKETGVSIIVSDRELRRKGKSYTFDTVTEIKEIFPDSELYLYIGSDMTESFEKWYRYEDILKICHIVTAKRYDDEALTDEDKLFFEKCEMIREKGIGITILKKDIIIASSTQIREQMKSVYEGNGSKKNDGARLLNEDEMSKDEKLSVEKYKMCPPLLTESVFRYIISMNMYR